MTDIATRLERLVTDDEFRRDLETLTDTTHPALSEIAASVPTYLIPDNPWLPWVNRAGGATMGVWTAATVSLLLGNLLLWWLAASAITVSLLFAWLVAGHELFEKHPTRFKQAP